MELKANEGLRFEEFVLSVIRQKCACQKRRFLSEQPVFAKDRPFRPADPQHFKDDRGRNENAWRKETVRRESVPNMRYDGVAPDGLDDFDGPVYIEVLYRPHVRAYKRLPGAESGISLYIISTSEKAAYGKVREENVVVWGWETISRWEYDYPIDFYAYTVKSDADLQKKADRLDFGNKNYGNKEMLRLELEQRNLSLSLGAGVSIEYGTPPWGEMISDFYEDIKRAGDLEDADAVQKKIGGTSIINGQFVQDNLKNFMKSLYKSLYGGYKSGWTHFYDPTLKYVVDFIAKQYKNSDFQVITYNFDDFLEQQLSARAIPFQTIYTEEEQAGGGLNIFHPHGFLPYGTKAADLPRYRPHIVFGESEYHKLYNDPLSWAMTLQQYLYRNYTFLFVGCSLTDPNLRRILENTKIKAKTHFALMLTDGLSEKDRFIVHRHFMRIGVECIWFDSVDDLKAELAALSR